MTVDRDNTRFLGSLPEPDLLALRACASEVRIQAGDTAFLEGDRSGRVVIVEAGVLRVSAVAPTGEELLIAFRGPGEILGEQSLLDGAGHGQTVRAVTDARVLSVGGEAFLDLLATRPGVSMALHRAHVQRLREADAMRLELATMDVEGRIARRLADLYASTENADVVISQQELANWVGASREAVTKGLAKLRRRGVLETSRGSIHITDPDGLRRVAAV
jgi:CRP-like cAMP-binding protein